MQSKRQFAIAVPLLASVVLSSVPMSAQSQSSSQQQQSAPSGVMVDPSAAPLKPSEAAPTEAPLPNAPQAAAPAQQRRSQSLQQPSTQPETQPPLGAAAAEQVRTAGGGASRPAGNAIAPAKQHQYRSLVIKLGAAAAAGIAAGTVYGLSHATSSTPPHSTTAATK